MKWGQSFRIRHITTGRYLCLDEEKGLLVVDPERANTKLSAFCFRVSKVRINILSFSGLLPLVSVIVLWLLRSLTHVIFSHPFFLLDSPEQEKVDVAQKRDVEGMGIPEIKYGESMCFVQHVSTGLWLTYAALDAKAARLGMMKRKVRFYLVDQIGQKLSKYANRRWCRWCV